MLRFLTTAEQYRTCRGCVPRFLYGYCSMACPRNETNPYRQRVLIFLLYIPVPRPLTTLYNTLAYVYSRSSGYYERYYSSSYCFVHFNLHTVNANVNKNENCRNMRFALFPNLQNRKTCKSITSTLRVTVKKYKQVYHNI